MTGKLLVRFQNRMHRLRIERVGDRYPGVYGAWIGRKRGVLFEGPEDAELWTLVDLALAAFKKEE